MHLFGGPMVRGTKRLLGLAAVVGAVVTLVGCPDDETQGVCGDGQALQHNGRSLCVYTGAAVIETGFNCPSARPELHRLDDMIVCAEELLSQGDLDEIHTIVDPPPVDTPDMGSSDGGVDFGGFDATEDSGSGSFDTGNPDTGGNPGAEFDCGANGGHCQSADQICLLSLDGCSTCVPKPASCGDAAGCSCLADEDMSQWTPACTGVGTCSESGGGLTVECSTSDFVCG